MHDFVAFVKLVHKISNYMVFIYTFGMSRNFLSAVFLSACRALRFLSRLSLPFWGEDSSDNNDGFLEMSCIKG